MKNNRLYIQWVLLIPTLIFFSCATQRGLTEKDIIITIETTPCMGNCPVFRAEIYSNGFIVYEGKQFVENMGMLTGKLSRERMDILRSAFEESDFFEMEDEYVEPWTDLPTVYVSYLKGGVRKRIKDYSGAPEKLKNLEKRVIEAIESANLRKRAATFLLTK